MLGFISSSVSCEGEDARSLLRFLLYTFVVENR